MYQAAFGQSDKKDSRFRDHRKSMDSKSGIDNVSKMNKSFDHRQKTEDKKSSSNYDKVRINQKL